MKRPRAILQWPAWILPILSACGEPPPTQKHLSLPPSSVERILVGSGLPTINVATHLLTDELPTTPPGISLLGDRLDFTAATKRPPSGEMSVELTATDRKGRTTSLWKGAPVVLDGLIDDARWQVFEQRVEVPLPAGYNELRWILHAEQPEDAALILAPRLIQERPLAPPSILLICSDTHRVDHALGPRGRELMPRLARLADEGLAFPAAFSSATWTLPSVTSSLTGLFPRNHLTGKRMQPDENSSGIPPGALGFGEGPNRILLSAYPEDLPSVFDPLQAAGYFTAIVSSNPLYITSGLAQQGTDLLINTGVVPGDQVNAAARTLLEHLRGEQPVALLVHYMDVHHWRPWYADPENVPFELAYERAVRDADRYLGSLLDAWDEVVGLDESLVVFYSDHGESLGRAGPLGHGHTMQEELLHVPLVARFPAALNVEPGTIARPVSLVDLFPTVLEVANLSAGGTHLDGRSLLSRSEDDSRALFSDFQLYGDESSSVRADGARMVLNWTTGARELIGTDDGAELERVYADYARQSAARTAALVSERAVDPTAVRRAMEDLGYFDDTSSDEDQR